MADAAEARGSGGAGEGGAAGGAGVAGPGQGWRLGEIAESASLCALFGVVAGGVREWRATSGLVTEAFILREEEKIRDKYKGRSFATPKSKRMLRYHAAKEAHGLRYLRVVSSSTSWCATFGVISAAYFALHQGLGIARQTEDIWNAVAAGTASGGALGLLYPGTGSMRFRGSLVGALAGGLLSAPYGYAKILAGNLEAQEKVRSSSSDGDGNGDGDGGEVVAQSGGQQAPQGAPEQPQGDSDKGSKPGVWGKLMKKLGRGA